MYGSFNNLHNLHTLKLADNRLAQIPVKALKQVYNLEYL